MDKLQKHAQQRMPDAKDHIPYDPEKVTLQRQKGDQWLPEPRVEQELTASGQEVPFWGDGNILVGLW